MERQEQCSAASHKGAITVKRYERFLFYSVGWFTPTWWVLLLAGILARLLYLVFCIAISKVFK
ncbi:hypothetical protein IQ22_04550 [Pseudomonas duriflava]|uniref:Uncharacterized protein n=2 Tax=Pseudomonas duriflava TaxID=459528 RepID=A0A562PNZ4_9PSED|nr:hypothetical protein IQ22_04550 [Pseudomonas duriflava]